MVNPDGNFTGCVYLYILHDNINYIGTLFPPPPKKKKKKLINKQEKKWKIYENCNFFVSNINSN